MTNNEIIEGDLSIAVFMGYTAASKSRLIVPYTDCTLIHIDSLRYHSDWNLLMPVVERISKVWWTDFNDIEEEVLAIHKNKVTDHLIATEIKIIWQSCIYFIKWHNTQTPNS